MKLDFSNKKLTVFKFSAEWCGPCKVLKPIFSNFSDDENTDFKSIDIDEFPGIASEYNVTSIPTIIFFKDGKEVNRINGVIPEVKLRSEIDKLI